MNSTEVWKDIPGYEDEYQASNLGNIRSIKSNNLILKGDYQPNGYKRVYLWKNGSKKNLLVHRLVALSFLPNPNNYEEVNHLDENKANNKLENLEWCTHSYNMNYGDVKKKISESHKGKVISEKSRKKLSENSKNRKWINNGKLEKCVKENTLNNFLINGWNFGRIKNMEV